MRGAKLHAQRNSAEIVACQAFATFYASHFPDRRLVWQWDVSFASARLSRQTGGSSEEASLGPRPQGPATQVANFRVPLKTAVLLLQLSTWVPHSAQPHACTPLKKGLGSELKFKAEQRASPHHSLGSASARTLQREASKTSEFDFASPGKCWPHRNLSLEPPVYPSSRQKAF